MTDLGLMASPESHDNDNRGTIPRPSRVDLLALLAMSASYVTILTYLCQLRFENFYTTNWDLGINQQMLWTTAHGQLLYKAGDLEFYGVHSFLEVHSTYIAIPLAYLYVLNPTAATLFALQSSAIAAAAFPLYFIARRVIKNRLLIFLLITIYLVNFAVISALFYDFHWEAFMPLEFLSFFYLLDRRLYAVSLIPMAIGSLTLEIFPFLVIGAVILGLYSQIERRGFWLDTLRSDRDVRALLALFFLAVAAYAMIRVAQYGIIPALLSQPSLPITGSQSPTAPFVITATATSLPSSALYWFLLVASLGLLPLLAPRYLILSLPWIGESVFVAFHFSYQFGDQYSLVAIGPLLVAAVFGLAWLERRASMDPAGFVTIVLLTCGSVSLLCLSAIGEGSRELLSGWVGQATWLLLLFPVILILFISPWHRAEARLPTALVKTSKYILRGHAQRGALRALPVGLLGCLIAFSLVMSPLNPVNALATQYAGYDPFHWTPNPAAADMGWITGQMPENAQVLASTNLFPFVADNPNAYAVTWYPVVPENPPYFPFNQTTLPRYVLVDSSQLGLLPSFLQERILDESIYGLVSYVFDESYPGTIYLFELGYSGVSGQRLVSVPQTNYFFSPSSLRIGASGRLTANSSELFGAAVSSRQAANSSGSGNSIWFGPYTSLLSGNYSVIINVSGGPANSSIQPTAPVLTVNAGVNFANLTFYSHTVSSGTLSSSRWVNLVYNISLPEPYPLVEFRGYLDYTGGLPNGYVVLNYIEVSAVG